MRDIKYRAWDGEKIRLDVTGFEHGDSNEMVGIFLNGDYFTLADKGTLMHPAAIAMQYTGAKDMNGVDIYEGDILATDDLDDDIASVLWDEVRHGWGLSDGSIFDDYHMAGFKVIGNIYQDNESVSVPLSDAT